jgi:hypothetical protein
LVTVVFPATGADSGVPNGSPSGGVSGGGGNRPYLDASVTPRSFTFDKNVGTDISITLSPGDYTLLNLKNGNFTLIRGRDYTVSGTVVTISAEYLSALAVGEYSILVDMSGGADPRFVIAVADSTPPGVPGGAPEPKPDPIPARFPFVDVNDREWYFGDVRYVWENGLMIGTAANLFSPDASTTRGMIVTVLYRLAGEPDVDDGGAAFDDVPADAWYAKAVAWAKANGIVLGIGDNLFAPDRPITRQELTAILSRRADFAGAEFPVKREYESFPDEAEIADYAKGAVETFFKAGIINGRDDGRFDPTGTATRAEFAAMLRRLNDV